jgi:tRNA pseudouridine55 synthase
MNGIVLIDKPAGPTSAEIVRQIKVLLGKRTRVGHLGTLDPFATGVLPILIGEGTKLAPFLQEDEKEYTGLIRLGIETNTLDSTGQITRTAPVPNFDEAQLERVAERFRGTIEQTPPIFSAIKRRGVPLYKLARRGLQVELPAPRRVTIHRLQLEKVADDALGFWLVCSSGMYVRALARDIGDALMSAAHLAELRRLRSGAFSIGDAHRFQDVAAAIERGETPPLISMRAALAALPESVIDPALERRIRQGDLRALSYVTSGNAGLFKVVSRGQLLAVARVTSRSTAAIIRVFGPDAEEHR